MVNKTFNNFILTSKVTVTEKDLKKILPKKLSKQIKEELCTEVIEYLDFAFKIPFKKLPLYVNHENLIIRHCTAYRLTHEK